MVRGQVKPRCRAKDPRGTIKDRREGSLRHSSGTAQSQNPLYLLPLNHSMASLLDRLPHFPGREVLLARLVVPANGDVQSLEKEPRGRPETSRKAYGPRKAAGIG